jgi:TATA-box binding protein (TBP) (component of TFIID and TFIIIB)
MTSIKDKIFGDDENISRGLLLCKEFTRGLVSCGANSLKITTMTIMMQLSVKKPLNIELLKEWFKGPANLESGWIMRENCRFYNCVVLCCNNGASGKIATKIFRNGNLHITGAKRIAVAYDYARVVEEMLLKYDKKSGSDYTITKYTVQLMNACMKIEMATGKCFCLKTLFTLLEKESNHFCIFNNDHHPGIRMKFKHESGRRSSIMIFRGGSVLFNAVLSGDELAEAYKFINEFIDVHFIDVVKVSVQKTPSDKKKFDYSLYI